MGTDVEIWMLFAPFWLLGMFAALGALWHFVQFLSVHGKAHAAGQVSKKYEFGTRLQPHETTTQGRHHLTRARTAVLLFVGFIALGLVAGVLWTLWRG